jgi:CRISPR-associated protein Cas6
VYWQESTQERGLRVPDDVVDVAYAVRCKSLPVEHAYALWRAVGAVLPWIADEEGAGVHPVHVADSGNGWMRPDRPDELLYLSRRTRLVVRVPKHRIEDAKRLHGQTLDVAGHAMQVEGSTLRSLSTHAAIFARYVVSEGTLDEQAFLAQALSRLHALGIRPKKMLCGIEKTIATPDVRLTTRSLMLADLTVEESVRLQQKGLGPMRHLGCGLFIPHKDIQELVPTR